LIFSREIRPEKNREIFDILKSHNILSSRYLQKRVETSIYKIAEIGNASAVAAAALARQVRRRGSHGTGKAEMSLKNLTTDAEG
jgi:hypothetical protein